MSEEGKIERGPKGKLEGRSNEERRRRKDKSFLVFSRHVPCYFSRPNTGQRVTLRAPGFIDPAARLFRLFRGYAYARIPLVSLARLTSLEIKVLGDPR